MDFEVAPGAGDRIVLNGGDLVGDLNLDARPNGDAEPFPDNFPKKIKRDTEVRVLKGGEQVLGCSLRVD